MEENLNSNDDNTRNDSEIKPEEPNSPLITFAKINKYFLIPFLCPVFCMLGNYFILLMMETKVVKKREIFLPIYVQFSYIFAGLLYFISYFKQKVEGGKEEIIYRERATSSIRYIYNEGTKRNPLKEWILIIFLGFLVALFELFSVFVGDKHVFEERLYFLFFIPLFSRFILKDTIFKHQYLSLIISIIGIIFLIIPICLKIESEDIVANILNFTAGIGYSLFLVIIKYVTHVYYISPFKLSLYFGLIATGFLLLGYMIYSLIEFHDLSFFKDILDFSVVDNKFPISIYLILTQVFATALQALTLLVIFYFSPILLMVTDIISPMLLWLALTIRDGQDLPDVALNPIGYIIVLFASLIYNEIIIFNFCDLSKDTKKFVEQRLNEESSDIRKTENDLKIGSFARSSDNDSNEAGDDEEKLSN
jgi:hypothetical protein